MSLNLTKARRALLQAIDDGAVTERYPLLPANPYTEWDLGPGAEGRRHLRVTKRVAQLFAAGLVRYGRRLDDGYKSPRLFVVTEAGKLALEATNVS